MLLISAMEAMTGIVQIHVARNVQTEPPLPPLIKENTAVDRMACQVNITTEVKPKIARA